MEGGGSHTLLQDGKANGLQHQKPLSPCGRPLHGALLRQLPRRWDRPTCARMTCAIGASAGDAEDQPAKPAVGFETRDPSRSRPATDALDAETGWAVDGPLPKSLRLGDPIGRGTFGVVHGATCSDTGRSYAVKVLKKRRHGYPPERLRARINNEVSVWMELHECRDVVRLHKCYEDDDHVYLVQDYCTGGSVEDLLQERGRLSEPEAAGAISGILRMVARCHQQNICYGDIKPSNFLVLSPPHGPGGNTPEGSATSQLLVKAVDFGSAQRTEPGEAKLMGASGTPLYTAPEVEEPPYGLESDVWSVGVMLYQLLSGRPPFIDAVAKTMRELNPASLAYAIGYVQLSFDFEPWEEISEGAKDLISKMLERDVPARISAEGALRHPWMKQHAVKDDVRGNIVVNKAEGYSLSDSQNVSGGSGRARKGESGSLSEMG